MTELSVVVPVYGNAADLPELHRRVSEATAGYRTELVLVDDASTDDSLAVIERLAGGDERVTGVGLERNVGQHEAVMEGLRRACGAWTVVMDADLQDPPEAIPQLLGAARAGGSDVVFAGRRGRYESLPRLASSRAFKRTLAAGTGLPPDAGMFFAANRTTIDRVLALEGPPPFVVAMIGRAGVRTESVPVARAASRGSSYSTAARVRSGLRGLRWALGSRPPEMERHNDAQRSYYSRGKLGMAPRRSRYLERHVDELVRFAGLKPGMRVLEVGPGQGRYTLPLADRGFRVEVIELAPAMLALLDASRGERQIELHEGDVLDPPASLAASLETGFDAVIGFFALHHMHDVPACLASMASLLREGGELAFLEPNPFNPLYYVQMAITPEMTFEGDKGVLGMRRGPLLGSLRAAGLERERLERFGFFPPFIADRPRAAGYERAIERVAPLRPFLPFQLVGGAKSVHTD